jgi:hypothetical protein
VPVAVGAVSVQDGAEVSRPQDQDAVGALAPDGADPAFGRGVRASGLRRCLDHMDTGCDEYGVERGRELAVPVADQQPEPLGVIVEVHEQVPRLLGDPRPGGMGL